MKKTVNQNKNERHLIENEIIFIHNKHHNLVVIFMMKCWLHITLDWWFNDSSIEKYFIFVFGNQNFEKDFCHKNYWRNHNQRINFNLHLVDQTNEIILISFWNLFLLFDSFHFSISMIIKIINNEKLNNKSRCCLIDSVWFTFCRCYVVHLCFNEYQFNINELKTTNKISKKNKWKNKLIK